ncbi:MAG: cupin domain-containing protein [Coriobacteriales bacterium]|nr:cupin domain-containing protein [Coriobacteriales bacterium]
MEFVDVDNRRDVANRIRSLREDNEFSIEEMAEFTGRSAQEYIARESGEMDLTFTFVYKCAIKLGVDVVELLTGESPRLRYYEVVRAGEGLPLERNTDFHYLHKAPHFRNRLGETFLVDVPYQRQSQHEPIHLSYHEGQEMDYVLKGRLRFRFEGDRFEEVGPGDTVFYDSGRGHGMIAIDGEDAQILAVVFKPKDEII